MKTVKKVMIGCVAIAALVISGCTVANSSSIGAYNQLTVCGITADKVLSSQDVIFKIDDETINSSHLAVGEVFEIRSTVYVRLGEENKYELDKVVKKLDEFPEPCN